MSRFLGSLQTSYKAAKAEASQVAWRALQMYLKASADKGEPRCDLPLDAVMGKYDKDTYEQFKALVETEGLSIEITQGISNAHRGTTRPTSIKVWGWAEDMQ